MHLGIWHPQHLNTTPARWAFHRFYGLASQSGPTFKTLILCIMGHVKLITVLCTPGV
ncbi:hypothetical protein HanRHA438_Chr04g0187821 [Helianthus annuus]|nr:hypothetical protein HanRHA438_Chr04g0187821 [Helianthus annuus]